ncbi:hypothetical protein D3C85_1098190 [compost metagenome]
MKYKFVQDSEGHWYLIPVELSSLFVKLDEDGFADDYEAFNDQFYGHMIDSPCHFTFENPK